MVRRVGHMGLKKRRLNDLKRHKSQVSFAVKNERKECASFTPNKT